MIRLSRLTPELRAALAARPFAPSSDEWAEAGRLGLACMGDRTPELAFTRWSLTDEGRALRDDLLSEPGGTVV